MDPKRLSESMVRRKLDAVILSSPLNIFYATGHRSFDQIISEETEVYAVLGTDPVEYSYLIAPHSERCLLLDFPVESRRKKWYGYFYIRGAEEYASDRVTTPLDGIVKAIRELKLSSKRIGIEKSILRSTTFDRLRRSLPKAKMVDASTLVRELRMVKNAEEISRIKKATEIAEKATYALTEFAKEGMTELELDREIRKRIVEQGANVSYIQVGAGERTAYVPLYATGRKLKRGDIIRVDASSEIGGYHSDISKMFALGEVSDGAKKYMEITRQAEEASLEKIRPGVKASDIFKAGVEVPKKAGYTDYFRHHVGHGLGLEPHEEPHLNPRNETLIEPNMVLCVETPYYIMGLGGFLPEDTVVVTKSGFEYVTRHDREIIVI
jgi:Xaa-Pro aminopeptidase